MPRRSPTRGDGHPALPSARRGRGQSVFEKERRPRDAWRRRGRTEDSQTEARTSASVRKVSFQRRSCRRRSVRRGPTRLEAIVRRKRKRKEKESDGRPDVTSDGVETQKRAAPIDTWTTWSGRRTTVRSVQPSQQQKRRIQKPAPDIGPWLASLRRARTRRIRERDVFLRVAARAPSVRQRPRRDASAAEGQNREPDRRLFFGKKPRRAHRLGSLLRLDDDAVAPSATLGVVEIASRAFTDPAELLATPAEVAYLGVAPAKGSGTPLYAANASDAERLNARKTPKAPRSATISEVATSKLPGFRKPGKKPRKPRETETPRRRRFTPPSCRWTTCCSTR